MATKRTLFSLSILLLALVFSPAVASASPTVSATINLCDINCDPYGVSADGAHVWVTNENGDDVFEISSLTGKQIRTIGVGAEPTAISSDGTHVWVANSFDDTVSEIVAATGVVSRTISLGGQPNSGNSPSAISSDGTHVWVGDSDGSVYEIDATTGALASDIPLNILPGTISSNGESVWAGDWGGSGDTLIQLSAQTGTVLQTLNIASSIFQVISKGEFVWITGTNGTLTKLNALTGTVVYTTQVFKPQYGFNISVDNSHVWASDGGATISEIDENTGKVISTINVGGPADALSSDNVHVWSLSTSTLSENTIKPTSSNHGCTLQKGANLSGCNFTNVTITGNLSNTNFTGADFADVTFTNPNMVGANFTNASFVNANVIYGNFSKANFTNSNLADTEFQLTQISGANLTNARMGQAYLNGLLRSRGLIGVPRSLPPGWYLKDGSLFPHPEVACPYYGYQALCSSY